MELKAHPAGPGNRAVFSVEAPSLATLAEQLRVPARYFVLLVAADTRAADGPGLVAAAEALVRSGVGYACCWGPGCERLETCFDEADIYVRGDEADGVIMTTSHVGEPLAEALWFAVNTAWPSGEFEGAAGAVVAAAVGSPAWAAEIRAYLDAGAPTPDEA